ncbi:MAG: Wzz/FepE/Etk N-terminal domain-containing protein [bacterium]|nr:Wzz/FepE/Etk N-terminal domain-containing protein [bacterium]
MTELIENEEIDLINVLKYFIKRWRVIAFCLGVGLILGIMVGFILPKQYSSYTSFIVSQNELSNFKGSSPFSSSYFEMISGSKATGTSSYMAILHNSRTFKENIVLNVMSKIESKDWRPYLDSDSMVIKIGKTKDYINFSNLELKNDGMRGDYMGFTHENADFIAIVLTSTIEELTKLNNRLQINNNSKIFEVLDYPITPKSPSKPNIIFLAVTGAFAGVFIGILLILMNYCYQSINWRQLLDD